MKTPLLLTTSVLIALTAPALAAQDADAPVPDTGPEETMTFPQQLLRLPEAVQDAAAEETVDAETAAVPDTLSAGEAAWYRAQIAYLQQDWISARRHAETAAAAGITDAALLAGLLARDGVAGGTDLEAAARWFRRAAEVDNPVALYQLGQLARLGDPRLGLGVPRAWFERAARANHINGMVAYAAELRASPVPQDAIAARQWAERAAQQGSAEGMYQLAQLLDAGEGGPRDADGARVWFERAAGDGHAEAAFQAGMMWADGEGGEADDARARDWLRIAAETGYAPAQGQYGLMLYQGRGGDTDIEEAAHWFGQGAAGGDAESQFLYAFTLARGEGLTQDLPRAYHWVLLAASDHAGSPVHDRDRDRLQAGLESVLDPALQAQIRAGIAERR